ncbi:MAG: hypothetical protein Q8936_14555 [Bacillota bacterium]|nr:hypothetical protein [Bacillota bacterium]
MSELCIFNSNKTCNDCGECDRCDLKPDKTCNNCGKCLELQGIDTKSIKIDAIISDPEEAEKLKDEIEYELDDKENDTELDENYELIDDEYTRDSEVEGDLNSLDTDELTYEFIDDIDGLQELMEDEARLKDVATEQFPGFYVIKNKK